MPHAKTPWPVPAPCLACGRTISLFEEPEFIGGVWHGRLGWFGPAHQQCAHRAHALVEQHREDELLEYRYYQRACAGSIGPDYDPDSRYLWWADRPDEWGWGPTSR